MGKQQFYQEIFATVLDHSLDLFAYIDMDQKYQYVSKSYAQFYGFKVSDLIGKQPQQVFHDVTYSEIITPHLTKCISSKSPVNFKAWITDQKTESSNFLYMSYLPHIDETSGDVVGVIVIARDVTEFKRAENLLAKSANTDALTNIPNRLFLENKLLGLTRNDERHSDRFAFLFCDLDGFKDVNDTYGHTVGDKVLSHVARRLSRNIRSEDILARYGGDEFVIIISPLVDDSAIKPIREKIERSLSQPFEISGNVIKVGISIGISIFPDDATSLADLIHKADKRMYDSKNQKL
jgi:diguanylate cyclase (GGDEF)-like protein/PAS domain S-box-containing protein